jgi:hypothetical protein
MHDANYRPLKDFVARRGGFRLAMHGGLRDAVVEHIVADWPNDCPIEHVEEVVRARIRLKVRERYGSVLGMIVLSAFINVIVRLIIEWWFSKTSHRVLMAGWAKNAQANPDIPN